ncbi:MAG TPA: hypothetical protein VH723_02165 [Candidatus Limnocylindrales bacterium]|jgi:hypothetical protein
MDWSQDPPLPPLATDRTVGGLRRGVMTAAIAGMLLIGGGVAAVSAASPDPSASTTPSTETTPSDDGTTSPDPSANPDTGRQGHDCPDEQADTESDASSG